MVEAPSIIFLIQKFSSARNNSVFINSAKFSVRNAGMDRRRTDKVRAIESPCEACRFRTIHFFPAKRIRE